MRSRDYTIVPIQACAVPTRLCPDTFVPIHIYAQTRLFPGMFVPRRVCAQRLCPGTFVPRQVCAQAHLCPYMIVPTRLCTYMTLPIYIVITTLAIILEIGNTNIRNISEGILLVIAEQLLNNHISLRFTNNTLVYMCLHQ